MIEPRASRRRQRGFSLPEIMLVLAIIMLLAALSIPRYGRAQEAAKEAAAVASMKSMHTSQEVYRITNGSYAPSFKDLTDTRGGPLLPGQMSQQGDTVVYNGYVFRLNRTAPDVYVIIAEPLIHRDTRPHFEMTQLGFIDTYWGEYTYQLEGGGATTGGNKKGNSGQ